MQNLVKIFLLTLCLVGLSLKSWAAESSKLEFKLRNLLIDEMEFKDTTALKAIKKIQARAKKIDPEKKGINLILLLDPKLQDYKRAKDEPIPDVAEGIDDDDDFLDEDNIDIEKTAQVKPGKKNKLSLKLKNVSLGQALLRICKAANLQYRVDKNAFIVALPYIDLGALEMRIYPMSYEEFFGKDKHDFPEKAGAIDMKEYFFERGISFPEGACIVLDKLSDRLIVINTYGNLRKIEQLISCLCVSSPLVVFDVKYVKMPEKDFSELKEKYESGFNEKSLWEYVLESEKTEILASGSVLTQNGEEATVRMVNEVFFPESWGEGRIKFPAGKINKADLGRSKLIERAPSPEFGIETELGLRFTITATIDPDMYTVSLDAIPIIQQHIGWNSVVDNNASKMPILRAFTSQTQATLYDGRPMLIHSFIEEEKTPIGREKNKFMLFYTVRLVNEAGVPLRGKGQKKRKVNWNPLAIIGTKKQPSLNPLEKKLDEIVFKHVSFEDAHICAVIRYIALEGENIDEAKRGVNIGLGMHEENLDKLPKLTFDLHDISLGELIKYICLMSDLYYRVDDLVLTIGVGWGEQFEFVKVSEDFIRKCVEASLTPKEKRQYDGGFRRRINKKILKDFFAARGVPDYEWTSMALCRGSNELLIKHTKENLERIKTILKACDMAEPQVMLEMTAIGISNKDLIDLIGQKRVNSEIFTPAEIEKILNTEKGETLFSQQITVRDRKEGKFKTGSEVFLPTQWDEVYVEVVEKNLYPRIAGFAFNKKPSEFGCAFYATPFVSPNNSSISVMLNAQMLQLKGWTEYDSVYAVDGKKFPDTIKLPVVSRNDLTTFMRSLDGQTLFIARSRYRSFPELRGRSFPATYSWTKLLDISKREKQELRNVFYFLNTRVIQPDGKYYREEIGEK